MDYYEDSGLTESVKSVINFLTFGNFFKKSVTVKATLTDIIDGSDTSGVASLQYDLGDGEGFTEATKDTSDTNGNTYTFTIPEGTSEISLLATDNVGNSQTVFLLNSSGNTIDSASWTIDTTGPQITGITPSSTEGSNTGADGNTWYLGDVTVSVGMSDDKGIYKLYESSDGTQSESVYDATKNGTADAAVTSDTYEDRTTLMSNTNGTTLFFNLSDLAGNWLYKDADGDRDTTVANWSASSVTIYIDKNDPAIDSFTVDPSSDWSTDSVSLNYTVSDVGSGIAKVEYARVKDADGTGISSPEYKSVYEDSVAGSTSSKTETITDITLAGTYELRVTDVAGRITTKTVVVNNLDTVSPTISVSYTSNGEDYTPGTWTAYPVTVTVTFADSMYTSDGAATADSAASDFGSLTYSYGTDGGDTLYASNLTVNGNSYSFTLSGDAVYESFAVYATDAAGNKSSNTEQASGAIEIDTTNPALSVNAKVYDTASQGITDYNGTTEDWATSGEEIQITLGNTATNVSGITYLVTTDESAVNGTTIADGQESSFSEIDTWITSNSLSTVAEWDSVNSVLTFKSSYEGTLYFVIQSESGLYSSVTSQLVQISTETFSAAEPISVTSDTSDPYTDSNGIWYNKTEGLTFTVTGATSLDNTDAGKKTPSNNVTTAYSLAYFESYSAYTNAQTSGDTGSAVTDASGELEYDSSKLSFTSNGTATITIPNGNAEDTGYYVLTVTVSDTAGNKSTFTKAVCLDVDVPTMDTVTYVINDNTYTWQDWINKITFGVFYNEGVTVRIKATESENESGVATVYYAYKDATDTTSWDDIIAAAMASGDSNKAKYDDTTGTYNFDLASGSTSGYIRYWAVDNAGNSTGYYVLGYDLTNGGSTSTNDNDAVIWKLESGDPELSLSASGNSGSVASGTVTAENQSGVAWFENDDTVTISGSVTDDGSGINSTGVTVYRWNTIADYTDSQTDGTDVSSDTSIYSGSFDKTNFGADEEDVSTTNYSATILKDGVYEITLTAKDNATNESTTTLVVYVDQTLPEITKYYDGSDDTTVFYLSPSDYQNVDYVTVSFYAQDETAGMKSISVSTQDGKLQTDTYGSVTVDAGTYTQTLSAETEQTTDRTQYSFNAYENGTYTVTLTDCAGNTKTYEVEVGNIDRQAPTLTSLTVTDYTLKDVDNPTYDVDSNYYTSDRIGITITADDDVSGIASYKLYAVYTQTGGSTTTMEVDTYATGDYKTDTTVLSGAWTAGESSMTVYIEQSSTYTLYVELTDNAGNTYSSLNYTTLPIRLENNKPTVIPSLKKYQDSKSDDYDGKSWTSADKVVLTLTSGLTSGTANFYVSLTGDDQDWTLIKDAGTMKVTDFTDSVSGYTYGTFASDDTQQSDAITFTVSEESSYTYYFKVAYAENENNYGTATVTIKIDRSSAATESDLPESSSSNWLQKWPDSVTLTDEDTSTANARSNNTVYYYWTENAEGTYTSLADAQNAGLTAGTVSFTTQGSDASITLPSDKPDGVWYLNYWTVDETAGETFDGNATENDTTMVMQSECIYVDSTAPTATIRSVTSSDSAFNVFNFGVFGNGYYTVEVAISDYNSGHTVSNPASITYSVIGHQKGDTDTYELTDQTVTDLTYYTDGTYTYKSGGASANVDGDGKTPTPYAIATFTLAEKEYFADAEISVSATDNAGNKCTSVTATAENTGSSYESTQWTYTDSAPDVDVTLNDSSEANTVGWMSDEDGSVVLTITAEETDSGINTVSYSTTGVYIYSDTLYDIDTYSSNLDSKQDETDTDADSVNYGSTVTKTTSLLTFKDLTEGTTELTATAVSNANNTGYGYQTLKVDRTKPTSKDAWESLEDSDTWYNPVFDS
ncbi:MAG: hypothetical protein LUE90_10115 [Clostridiales bacterium]|nr:hypothetical protein [Clostridiales bacterium]